MATRTRVTKAETAATAAGVENSAQHLQQLDQRIENLKSQFILFFSGELKIPPENERAELEKAIHRLTYSSAQSPRLSMLIQNLASKFSLFNNLWLKKLNELEAGTVVRQGVKASSTQAPVQRRPGEREVRVSLNDETSFERFYQVCLQLNPKTSPTDTAQKEKIIAMLKAKLITSNLVEAKINVSLEKGKLNIKTKK